MRGTLLGDLFLLVLLGIIPAYAGNTSRMIKSAEGIWDHPRVCGEHPYRIIPIPEDMGSSPRMRGTRNARHGRHRQAGIIPAYAGNTNYPISSVCNTRDHPRVCGEHQLPSYTFSLPVGSSPRMRGTPNVSKGSGRADRIIPAYAGNTLRDYSNFVVSKFMSFVFHLV